MIMIDKKKKLVLVQDIVSSLKNEGIVMTPNAIGTRLRNSMLKLAEESCKALGIEMEQEQLERISTSRAFQEAVANILCEEKLTQEVNSEHRT